MAERTSDSEPATTGDRVPEHGIGQFPEASTNPASDEERIREEYGWLRSYYKQRPRKYRDLQRWLNQSRFGVSYDVYLAESAYYAVLAVVLGALFGVLVTLAVSNLGLIAGLSNPFTFRGDITRYIGRNRSLFAGAGISIVLSILLGGTVWYGRYIYPRYVADGRRRNIDITLPHAITFMYALSYGGMSLLETMHALADADDTYGDVALEFEMIVRDVELFGNDLYTAVRNARNLTPSDNLEQFLDDLLAILDAGGDVAAFFRDETDTYLEEAREEQDNFISTLELMSEVFVVGFVAAPLFLVVILLVISLLGGQTLGQLSLLIYAILPLGMAGFLVLIDTLSEPYRAPEVQFEVEQSHIRDESGILALSVLRDGFEDLLDSIGNLLGSETQEQSLPPAERTRRAFERYKRHRREREFWASLSDPMAFIRRKPLRSLAVTSPLAVLVLAGLVLGGVVEPTQEAFLTAPVPTTTLVVILPMLIIIVPLSLFHELKMRRETAFAQRFPDTLNVLSSANRMGISFTDALKMVAQWTQGPLAIELQKVRNDIRWNFDTRSALLAFGNRIKVANLTRTLKLVAEGTRSSSDIARVLTVAAEDARERFKIDRRRRQSLSAYTTVVIIGFMVYMLVIVLLDTSYLDPIANAPPVPQPEGVSGTTLSMAQLPVEAYQALFFHSALIQAIGVGLIAGKLSRDSVLSGLKYSIALIALTLITFAFL
jgi:flagellar protein FlaJ